MKRVYKYPLLLKAGEQTIDLPASASIVHVHAQDERPCLWAEVNPGTYSEPRTFSVVATGEAIPADAWHIGTVHIGWTVWHIYDHKVPF